MMNRILTSALAASLAFSLVACSEDNGLGPAIQLTEAETEDMMETLGVLAFEGTFQVPGQAAAAIHALRNPDIALATVNVNQTLECPVSGSRHTTGSIVSNDEETELDATFTQTYSNCGAAAESGTIWTFNTDPNLVLTLSATNNLETETLTANMNFNGGFQVASDDGRSGSCVVTLAWTLSASGTSESLSATVSGTVCGRAVSQTVDITG